MKQKNFLDPTIKTEGEQLINQQIIESYHSGVIDHDMDINVEREQEIE